MQTKTEITRNWLPRYTGMPLDQFGDYILVTNFGDYVRRFAKIFDCRIYGEDRTMQAATNDNALLPADQMIWHWFKQCGDDHGFAHGCHAKRRAVPRQVRRPEEID